jgi:hypothetical protein
VTAIPPLTLATIVIALLTLPLLVVAIDLFGIVVSPVVTIAIHWALAAIVFGIGRYAEGLSAPELGFRRPSWLDLGIIVPLSVAILLVYALTDPLVDMLGLPVSPDAGLVGGGMGIDLAIALAVTTGVVEEVLYRGYPIERLFAYTDSSLVAGGVTWGVFTLAHAVSWPLGNLLQTAVVAGLLTVMYLWRRTLVPVIGAHVAVWVFAAFGQVYG